MDINDVDLHRLDQFLYVQPTQGDLTTETEVNIHVQHTHTFMYGDMKHGFISE